ncbi:hypothetical protein ACHAPT_012125 [Fusarium lateritium]
MSPLERQSELDAVCSALEDVARRLGSTTQDAINDPIIKIAEPHEVPYLKKIATPGSAHSIEQVLEEAFTVFDYRMRVNHPRFMGLIPSPTSPVAWLGDVVASAFNALGASKFHSSGPVVIEKTLIEWMASRAGFPSTAGGVCVSGGSMANLMGIVLARDHCLPQSRQHLGVAYMSDQTHYSVVKALRLLGFGREQIRRIPADKCFRLDPTALAKAIQNDRREGLLPFIVVGTCGTTNTGAIDPLRRIAEICKIERLWLHVDGAYGASVALSSSRYETVHELKYADSLSWDAHKWLFQTYSCGLLITKDRASLVKSFVNEGDYLRDGVALQDEEIPNFWNYSMELTRPSSRAMKLWFTLRVIGVDRLGRMLDHGFKLAERAEKELKQLPDWEIMSPASLGVITFRYAPKNNREDKIEDLNGAISKGLISTTLLGL